jgi:hypothetical protein
MGKEEFSVDWHRPGLYARRVYSPSGRLQPRFLAPDRCDWSGPTGAEILRLVRAPEQESVELASEIDVVDHHAGDSCKQAEARQNQQVPQQ